MKDTRLFFVNAFGIDKEKAGESLQNLLTPGLKPGAIEKH